MFTNHGKEDGINPLKRDSKAQNKDQRSIVITCTNTYKGFAFSTHENIIVQYKDETLSSQHLYRTGQSVGITVTFSNLATQVSEQQHNR
jgi:hypothetical protein